MTKLFTTGQIAGIDRYTIENEPIPDIDLMERAAWEMFLELYPEIQAGQPLVFFAGPGNNGGDALAMARLFAEHGYDCVVYLLDTGKPWSGSPAVNKDRLTRQGKVDIKPVREGGDFPVLYPEVVIIDGLFGSGLKRPLEGLAAALVSHINHSGCKVVAIDIPSGLMGEDNSANNGEYIIRASVTLTLQFPKLSLLFPENAGFAGEVRIIDIGLHPEGMEITETPYCQVTSSMVRDMIPDRPLFAHKGTFGHALLIAGSSGKMGAAVLAARGCLRSGAGLVTTHVPAGGSIIVQTAVPEAMCSIDRHSDMFSELPGLKEYNAIGVGPGLGRSGETLQAFRQLLRVARVPLVIDADGLNLMAENPELWSILPSGTILTPHPGEFKRLFGYPDGSWKGLQLQREMAARYGVVIVLKGANTAIALPDGSVYFNTTGNPGMATGGSGDVLTGIITGLLAQGLRAGQAAIAGVYLHGLAGDIASAMVSRPGLVASDIAEFLGQAYKNIIDADKKEF